MPWDHAAGCLIHAEAGGYAAFLDGRPYSVLERPPGLLCAADEASWHLLREALAGEILLPPGYGIHTSCVAGLGVRRESGSTGCRARGARDGRAAAGAVWRPPPGKRGGLPS